MSTTVDSRVVEMRFDNRNFEENIQTSLSTIEKLQQSLNLKGATKGLESVDTAARNVNMGGLGDAVEAVKLKFSSMQVMAITALSNITNQAVNAGKRIISAFTIDPIKTGFSEYETKINAVQTILANTANKGTKMEDVTKALDKLNEYADRTIYNFAEMTRNIGIFTTAGIGLEDSTASIQGIANLAAVSGASASTASNVMYQLSQAMSSGTLRLQDWMSVERGGMAGEKFREALQQTAREHGIAVDEMIEKNGGFRESLREGWASAEILSETLKKFTVEGATEYANAMLKSGKYTKEQADALIQEAKVMENAATEVKTFTQMFDALKEAAQSGWAKTWELILGDFEEAKETFSKIHKTLESVINGMSDARNNLLKGWKDAGGRADLIDSLFNIIKGIQSIISPIKEAFRDIFPPLTVKALKDFTAGLKELTSKFKLSDAASDNLKRTFKGLFAVVDIVKQVIVEVFSAIGQLTGNVAEFGGGILDVTASIGDWLVKLSEAIKKSGVFKMVLGGVVEVIKFLFSGFKNFASFLAGTFSFVGDAVSDAGNGVVSAVEAIGSAVSGSSLLSLIKGLWEGVKVMADGLFGVLGKLGDELRKGLNAAGINSIFDLLNVLISGGLGVSLIGLIKSFTNAFNDLSDSTSNIREVFGSVRGVLEGYQSSLKADALLKIAAAIAILVGSIAILSTINSRKLLEATAAIYALFAGLMGSFAMVNKSSKAMGKFIKASTVMLAMSTSVLILAVALKHIASLDFVDLAKGILGVGALMGIMVAMARMMTSNGKAMVQGAGQMLVMAGALVVLAGALRIVAALNWDQLAVGLTGIATVTTILVAAAKLMSIGDEVEGANDLLTISIALGVLALSLKLIATLDWEHLAIGLIGMTSTMGILIGLAKVLTVDKNSPKAIQGVGKMLVLSGALAILAASLKLLSTISWEGIAKSLIGITAVAGILIGMTFALSKVSKDALAGTGALMLMSAAMVVLAGSLMIFEHISWGAIVKGLVTVTVALGVLVGVGALVGALASGMQYFLAGLVVVLGGVAILAASMLVLGAGLVLAASSFDIAAVGLIHFSEGLSELGKNIGILAEAMASTVTGIVLGLAEGIILACEVIIKGAPTIGKAIKTIVLTTCSVLRECVPEIARTILYLIDETLIILGEYAPRIVDHLLTFIIGVIDAVTANVPKLLKSITGLLEAIFDGLFSAMGALNPESLLKAVAAISMIVGIIYALGTLPPVLVGKAAIALIAVGGIIAELAIILAAIGGLAQISGLNWLINEGGELLQNVGRALGGFVGGIAGGIAEGFSASLPEIGSHLSGFMQNAQPFFDGLKNVDATAVKSVKTLAELVLILTAAELIDRMTSWAVGGSSITKFGTEIVIFGKCVKKFADTVSGIDVTAVKSAASAGKTLAEMASIIPNEGGLLGLVVGENSSALFGSQLVLLGKGLKKFSEVTSGIDTHSMSAATDAAKELAEMADVIPNMGGLVDLFEGYSDPATFGLTLGALGKGLASFSAATSDIDTYSMSAATDAAKELAEMAAYIPKMGGLISYFGGTGDPATFGMSLGALGAGLVTFSTYSKAIDAESMSAATDAAKELAEMSTHIPKMGGMISYFQGTSDPATFGLTLGGLGAGLASFSAYSEMINAESMSKATKAAAELAEMSTHIPKMGGIVELWEGYDNPAVFGETLAVLGLGLASFSKATENINTETMSNATTAATELANMATHIPALGGIKGLFEGYSDPGMFGASLFALGQGLASFSTSTENINTESVTNATKAAIQLAKMSSYIPALGGLKGLWEGYSDPSLFGMQLKYLGQGLADFSAAISVDGFNVENVSKAATAAKSLAEMCSYIPNIGGMQAWFTGDSSVAIFGSQLASLGKGLAGFSTAISVDGFDPEAIAKVAPAAKALAEMCSYIPETGGMQAWFTGDVSVAQFGTELGELGKGLASFSTAISVDGFNPENVQAAANAAKALAEMCAYVPSEGGIKAWFTGENSVVSFASDLPKLGEGLAAFSASISVDGFNPENIQAAANAAKTLAEMTKTTPEDTDKIVTFGENLTTFAGSLSSYFETTGGITEESISASTSAVDAVKKFSNINAGGIKTTAEAIDKLVYAIKGMAGITADSTKGFVDALANLAEANIQGVVKAFEDMKSDMTKAGETIMKAFAKGISDSESKVTKAADTICEALVSSISDSTEDATGACTDLVDACADAISGKASSFETAGANLAKGFANGISKNSYLAAAKARAMAAAAAKAAKEELDEHSPSKVGYSIGDYFGLGFVNAIVDYADKSYAAGSEIAGSARDGLNSAVSKINDILASNIDNQPTIRPVLDLSNIRNGAGAIGDLIGAGSSIGVAANVGAISSMMNNRSQNGTTNDVISAIDKLRKDLKNVGNTSYSIAGITYDESSSVASAIEAITRAAINERRM